MVRVMRRIALMSLIAFGVAGPAAGDELVTPEAFEAYAEGYTLYFTEAGERFGEETYLEQRQTLWRNRVGHCQEGYWYDDAGAICFVYPPDEAPVCWAVLRDAKGLYAKLLFEDGVILDGLEIRIAGRDREPLPCAFHGV